jgi:hypothetical protein
MNQKCDNTRILLLLSVIVHRRNTIALQKLLGQKCDRVRDYLQNNPNVSESDRHLCDGIGTQKR